MESTMTTIYTQADVERYWDALIRAAIEKAKKD